jgi:hypothetical protein
LSSKKGQYGSYNFIDKDPVIDILRTMKRDVQMSDREISDISNVTTGTLRNWFGGKTRRPLFATAAAVAAAMGFDSVPITSNARRKLKSELKEE